MTPLEKYEITTRKGQGAALATTMLDAIFAKLCPNNDRCEEDIFDMPDILVAREGVVGLTLLLLTYCLGDDHLEDAFEDFVRDLRSMYLAEDVVPPFVN